MTTTVKDRFILQVNIAVENLQTQISRLKQEVKIQQTKISDLNRFKIYSLCLVADSLTSISLEDLIIISNELKWSDLEQELKTLAIQHASWQNQINRIETKLTKFDVRSTKLLIDPKIGTLIIEKKELELEIEKVRLCLAKFEDRPEFCKLLEYKDFDSDNPWLSSLWDFISGKINYIQELENIVSKHYGYGDVDDLFRKYKDVKADLVQLLTKLDLLNIKICNIQELISEHQILTKSLLNDRSQLHSTLLKALGFVPSFLKIKFSLPSFSRDIFSIPIAVERQISFLDTSIDGLKKEIAIKESILAMAKEIIVELNKLTNKVDTQDISKTLIVLLNAACNYANDYLQRTKHSTMLVFKFINYNNPDTDFELEDLLIMVSNNLPPSKLGLIYQQIGNLGFSHLPSFDVWL
jgi:hypothetical protein